MKYDDFGRPIFETKHRTGFLWVTGIILVLLFLSYLGHLPFKEMLGTIDIVCEGPDAGPTCITETTTYTEEQGRAYLSEQLMKELAPQAGQRDE